MNCEHVEERLSAYLDNMLAAEEYRTLTLHLHSCTRCLMSLTELRRNDMLVALLPRVSPHSLVQERLFSSPEILALPGTEWFL